jgi:hypothetical protein
MLPSKIISLRNHGPCMHPQQTGKKKKKKLAGMEVTSHPQGAKWGSRNHPHILWGWSSQPRLGPSDWNESGKSPSWPMGVVQPPPRIQMGVAETTPNSLGVGSATLIWPRGGRPLFFFFKKKKME